MARSIVTSSISRRNCYGVENHCPYSSNSSARISRKSGMSPLLLGSGRPWSHTSPAPLLAHHLTCGWSHQWILLRVTILVDGFRPLYVVPIFLLSRARLSQSFRPKLPCQRGCFVSWYLMMLFFLLALSRQVEGAALQLRPTPVMAVVTPPPVPFTRIHVAYPRQLSSSATPTSGESATTITSGDSGTSTEVPTSADSSFSTSDLTTDVSVSITSDFPTSVSTLDPTTSVSISISVGPSSEPTSETPSSAPSSEPTSQPPTSGPPSSEPTSQPPSSEPSSQPTSEPPTSEPTSSPSTSEPPPSSTPPSSSFSVSPTSLPPSSPPTSIPPSSIPPSSAPSTAPSPQPTSDLSSSTLSSSNTMTATTPPVSITTSSSTTLTFTSSSESFSLSSSPSEPPATSTSTQSASSGLFSFTSDFSTSIISKTDLPVSSPVVTSSWGTRSSNIPSVSISTFTSEAFVTTSSPLSVSPSVFVTSSPSTSTLSVSSTSMLVETSDLVSSVLPSVSPTPFSSLTVTATFSSDSPSVIVSSSLFSSPSLSTSFTPIFPTISELSSFTPISSSSSDVSSSSFSAPLTSSSTSSVSSSTILSTSNSETSHPTFSSSDISISTSISADPSTITSSAVSASSTLLPSSASSLSPTSSPESFPTSLESSTISSGFSTTSSDGPAATSTSNTSSRPVLQPSGSFPLSVISDETSTSSTSVVHSHFSTMFTTIVLTSTFTNQGSTGVTTVTSIVATGTLIPNSDSTNGNIFDHNPGAIAGVVIGIVAFVALLACWLFIARRRHHLRIREAELAALSGGTSGLGRSGLGGTRTLILDDDDRDDILRNPPDSPMEERPGPVVALRGGEYSRTNSELPEHQDIESPDNPPGDAISDTSNHTHLGSSHDVGSTEQDALMGNSPRLDVAEIEPLPVARRAMSARSRASSGMSGPDPAAWLSNRDIPYVPVNTVSPQLSSPGFGQSSSEERMATMSFASRSSDMLHLLASPDVAYASGNTSGSGSHGSGSGDRMSMSVLPYAGGSGSSGNGHSAAGGSSSGHGGSSSQGHGTSSAGSHSRGVPFPEGRKSPGPSSLLPSQTQMPPTAFRPVDDDKKGRRRSFLGRSLKWRIRSGRLSDVSSTSSVSNYSTKSPTPTTPSFADGRPVGGDDPSTVTPQPHLSRGSSISRPFSATLGNLPSFAHPSFRLPGSAIPEDGVPSGSPRWPSFEVPDLPSPALTERSSQNAPEGLLDPRLGLHLGTGGVESTAAISLRDDQDYSRPIGGLVNNRMYSTTTFHTLDTRDSRPTTRRNSAESRGTGGAGAETDRAQEGS
ncbi:unnamed protein product [Somion occarium]|uniref:Transmembrane protein n=1 Tax=Somion occarium TaxID=3059160 RepID=A0ABP1DNF6_9APHY